MKAALHAPAAEVRDAQRIVDVLAQDVRHACRMLRRQPVHSALAVLTMALGVGATTTLFSLAYGVLYRPLPWPDATMSRFNQQRGGLMKRVDAIMNERGVHGVVRRLSSLMVCAAWRVDPVLTADREAMRDREPRGGGELRASSPDVGAPTCSSAAGRTRRPTSLARNCRRLSCCCMGRGRMFRRTPDAPVGSSASMESRTRVVAAHVPPVFAFRTATRGRGGRRPVRFDERAACRCSVRSPGRCLAVTLRGLRRGTACGGPEPGAVATAASGLRAPFRSLGWCRGSRAVPAGAWRRSSRPPAVGSPMVAVLGDAARPRPRPAPPVAGRRPFRAASVRRRRRLIRQALWPRTL